MVRWFKTSLKQRNADIAERKEIKAEIGELQDATIELAEIVSELADDNTGGEADG